MCSSDLGAGEITRFLQQSASSAVLNRVVGAMPSSIMGQLLSNGRVYLINPHGILFGAGARIDVAGLVASTLQMNDADFLAGRHVGWFVIGASIFVQPSEITGRREVTFSARFPGTANPIVGMDFMVNGELYSVNYVYR